MIKVTTKEVENMISISIHGTLIYGKTEYANNELAKIKTDYKGYIIHLSDIEKIDSTGFGVLINFAKRLENKRVLLVVENDFIKRLIYIAKLNLIFSIVDSEEEAINMIDSKEVPPLSIDDY